jgi:hypothetical protein
MPANMPIGVMIFAAALGVDAVALVLGIAETIAIARFVPWVFRLGPRVVQRALTLRPPVFPSTGSNTIELQYGYVRILGPTECLFRVPMGMYPSGEYAQRFRHRSTWERTGVIRWQGTQAQVECRLPMTAVVFAGASLVGWTAPFLSVVLFSDHLSGRLIGAILLLIGWAAIVGISRSNLRQAREWVDAILTELDSALAGAAA